jgi:hypothetical protein
MSTAVLDRIRTERDEVRALALKMVESEDFNPEDETYKELETRAAALDTRAAKLVTLLEGQADADKVFGRIDEATKRQQERAEAETKTETREGRSWGELFVRSEAYEGYGGNGKSKTFDIDSDTQIRALPTGLADLVAAGMTPDKFVVDTTPPPPPTPLLQAITTIQIQTNSVEYQRWEKKAGGAAKVAEKAVKPSAEFGPVIAANTLDNIAVWTQLTRQLLEDKRAVRDTIDGELRRDILLAEEADAAAKLVAAVLPTATDDTLLKAIRKGVGVVQAAGYQPNAVLLNPADYAELDIDVMGATLGGPTMGRGFWGLIPVPASSQAAGTATVGDFKAGVKRFIRSDIGLYITDSHAETFTSNVFTLLAERRSLTDVVRPQALAEASVA